MSSPLIALVCHPASPILAEQGTGWHVRDYSATHWRGDDYNNQFSAGNLHSKETIMGRGILLWLLGIPIPIIILILLFWH